VVAQMHLRGGTVLVEGYASLLADGPSTFALPVIGSTGIYANARGSIKVWDLGNGQQQDGTSNIEFHLLS
jgi:hypothetical protein